MGNTSKKYQDTEKRTRTIKYPCEDCNQTGWVYADLCKDCNGTGYSDITGECVACGGDGCDHTKKIDCPTCEGRKFTTQIVRRR